MATHIESAALTVRQLPSPRQSAAVVQCTVASQLGWQKVIVVATPGGGAHTHGAELPMRAADTMQGSSAAQWRKGKQLELVPSHTWPARQKGEGTAGIVLMTLDEHGLASTPFSTPSPSQSPLAQLPLLVKQGRTWLIDAGPLEQTVTNGRPPGSRYWQTPGKPAIEVG